MFLQQLGRGLRLSPETGKSCLTVLDFIGQQHRRFRFDLRFRALLGGSRRQVERQVEHGFPFLPPGCRLLLDRVSRDSVLRSLRDSLPSRLPSLLQELRSLAAEGLLTPESGLADWLQQLGMEPSDFYGVARAGYTVLRRELGWLGSGAEADLHPVPHPEEERLTRAIGSGLLHMDDPERLRWLVASLSAPEPPVAGALGERELRSWRMLLVQLFGSGPR